MRWHEEVISFAPECESCPYVAQSFLRLSGSCSKNIGVFLSRMGVHVWCLKGSIDFYSSAAWITFVLRN